MYLEGDSVSNWTCTSTCQEIWCPLILSYCSHGLVCEPDIIRGCKWIAMVQGADYKTSFYNFSDWIGFTDPPNSCHHNQPTQCRPMNFATWGQLATHKPLSSLSLSDSALDEMPHKRAFILASEKPLKVLNGANQLCWGAKQWDQLWPVEARDGREAER